MLQPNVYSKCVRACVCVCERAKWKRKQKHYSFIHMESSPKWLYLSLADYNNSREINISVSHSAYGAFHWKDALHTGWFSTLDCNTCISCKTWKHAKLERNTNIIATPYGAERRRCIYFCRLHLGQWSKVFLYILSCLTFMPICSQAILCCFTAEESAAG